MPYYPALDGVRAYCVFLVMFDHIKSDGHAASWIHGGLGVDLFFILSGFLITTLLRREQLFTGRLDLSAFYWRRVFRLLPVYFVVLALYVVVCHMPGQALHWTQLKGGLPYFLTMMNEYAKEPLNGTVFGHTWSIGVEEKFYLVWPVVFFLMAKTQRARVAVLALGFALVALSASLGEVRLSRAYFGLLVGCTMAILLSGKHGQRIMAFAAGTPTWIALFVLAFGFYMEHFGNLFLIFFSPAIVFFFIFMMARPSWLRTAHEWPPLVWLGKRSYSMYLVHVLCLNFLEGHMAITSGWRVLGALCIAYAAAALIAEVLYRAVEEPCRQFGRRWLASRAMVPAAE